MDLNTILEYIIVYVFAIVLVTIADWSICKISGRQFSLVQSLIGSLFVLIIFLIIWPSVGDFLTQPVSSFWPK